MDDTLLQLGLAAQPHKLAASSSYVQRGRPALSTTIAAGWTSSGASGSSGGGSAPYVTQLERTGGAAGDVLLSYADDEIFRHHDKATLKTLASSRWEQGGACTCLKAAASGTGYVATGRNGLIGFWDTRQRPVGGSGSGSAGARAAAGAAPALTLAGPSHAPYLSLDLMNNSIAAGTELQGVDAQIDLWDVRQTAAPVLTYEETHSDDITALAFHAAVPSALLSASSDALVAISDTRQANEDDSVLGVTNTGASVARAGWGGSARHFPKAPPASDDDEQGDAAQASPRPELPGLGAFWSMSDMQTLGIWEADSFSELLPPSDVRQTQAARGALAVTANTGGLGSTTDNGTSSSAWQSEYIIDASTDASLLENVEGIGLFCGEQNGGMALIEVPNMLHGSSGEERRRHWLLHCRTEGGHSDIVRSVAWDAEHYVLFSGGEDGRICAWSLAGDRTDGVPLRSGAHGDGADGLEGGGGTAGPARGKGANAIPMAPRSSGGGSGSGGGAGGPQRAREQATSGRDRSAFRPY